MRSADGDGVRGDQWVVVTLAMFGGKAGMTGLAGLHRVEAYCARGRGCPYSSVIAVMFIAAWQKAARKAGRCAMVAPGAITFDVDFQRVIDTHVDVFVFGGYVKAMVYGLGVRAGHGFNSSLCS